MANRVSPTNNAVEGIGGGSSTLRGMESLGEVLPETTRTRRTQKRRVKGVNRGGLRYRDQGSSSLNQRLSTSGPAGQMPDLNHPPVVSN